MVEVIRKLPIVTGIEKITIAIINYEKLMYVLIYKSNV